MLHHITVGTGKPLIILHGVSLDHRYMMEAVEPVFDGLDGWQRIYPDMPGHGQSPPRPEIASQDDLLASVLAFADAVLPGQRFGVIGLSRGSYIARGMVHVRPTQIAGVALIVPGGNPGTDPARLPAHQVMQADPSMRAELTDDEVWRFDNFMVVQRRDLLDTARRVSVPAKALFDAEQDARVFDAFDFSFHRRGESAVCDGPSLIIAGRQDSISGYLDAMDLLPQFPRATLCVLDAAGHGVMFERAGLVQSLLRDWLERLDHDWHGST
ncbi:alpha/beta hydrolase [Antarctobacter sp.]|uniref:alpha/beta fold hydrolase n=1 Tax=Antarctobacter sp. TaxID=1872577 RepID=UPI002B277F1E|nr:alpha/beta hydrolase [Antarctobacter sp.]